MKKKMLVCEKWYELGLHPYTIQKRSNHPVHMICDGDYLTEDTTSTPSDSDMGTFGLNAKEYEIFKKNLVEREIEVIE